MNLFREHAMTEPPRDARQRAEEYKEQKESSESAKPAPAKAPKSEAQWRDAVSQAIEEAMRQGEFDNLRGRGKPLNLDRDPFTPEGSELAYDIMRNNQIVPAWLGSRIEILREIDRWRGRASEIALRMTAEQTRMLTPQAQEMFRRRQQAQRETFRTEIEALNRRIRDVNLQQPVVTMEVFMLRLDEELRKAGFPIANAEGS
jgi:hypothetical protein